MINLSFKMAKADPDLLFENCKSEYKLNLQNWKSQDMTCDGLEISEAEKTYQPNPALSFLDIFGST